MPALAKPGQADGMTPTRIRWAVSILAILGTLPYITLKVMWLSGSRVGLVDPGFGRSATMHLANALTMGMDATAIALALAFVMPWGRRLPNRLVLLPMWVATGLLAPIVVIVPLQIVIGAPTPTDPDRVEPIAHWVYEMVYAGFMWQGVFLLTAFTLYAAHRWGGRWGLPLTDHADRRAAGVVLGLLAVAASGAVLRADDGAANLIGDLATVAAAAAGVLLMATPVHLPRRWPIVLTWLGSGAMAAWGLYTLVLLVVPNDLVGDRSVPAADIAAQLAWLGAGLAAAWLGVRTLRSDRAADDAAGGSTQASTQASAQGSGRMSDGIPAPFWTSPTRS